jgi:hypothetical protein
MPTVLHLLKQDSPSVAVSVIEANRREPGAHVTVVVLEGDPPALPRGADIRRLADGDLDYAALLDLIFASDRVVTW